MNPVIEASRYAWLKHRDQIRKRSGEPYFFHLARVSARISSLLFSSEDMVVAAWLHDVIEDTATHPNEIEMKFNKEVKDLVIELTNVYTKECYPSYNRKRRKDLELQRIAKISDEAKIIKLADRLDNIQDIEFLSKKQYYISETYDMVDEIGYACKQFADEIYLKLEELGNESCG